MMHAPSRFLLLVALLPLLLASCKSTVSHKSTVPILNPAYTGTFTNQPYKSKKNKHFRRNTLLEVFKLDSAAADWITIAFDSAARLRMSYTVDGIPHEHIFAGTFTKKGTYKFIFQNYRKDVPPIFPIVYSQHSIRHIRLSLKSEGSLFLREHWDYTGTVFIFAAGSAGNQWYCFKKSL